MDIESTAKLAIESNLKSTARFATGRYWRISNRPRNSRLGANPPRDSRQGDTGEYHKGMQPKHPDRKSGNRNITAARSTQFSLFFCFFEAYCAGVAQRHSRMRHAQQYNGQDNIRRIQRERADHKDVQNHCHSLFVKNFVSRKIKGEIAVRKTKLPIKCRPALCGQLERCRVAGFFIEADDHYGHASVSVWELRD
jgi:hypothetical protein